MKNYIAPQIEVLEIEVESNSLLTQSELDGSNGAATASTGSYPANF